MPLACSSSSALATVDAIPSGTREAVVAGLDSNMPSANGLKALAELTKVAPEPRRTWLEGQAVGLCRLARDCTLG